MTEMLQEPGEHMGKVLAGYERGTGGFARWCVARGITPNMLTTWRIVSTPLLFYTIWQNMAVASILLGCYLGWLDIQDGRVAREMDKIKPGSGSTALGKILDPISDKFLIIGGCFLMAQMPWEAAVAITAMELILMGARPLRALRLKLNRLPPSMASSNLFGKIKVWGELFMLMFYILDEPYAGHVTFVACMLLGALSFLTHLRLPKPTQS